MKTTKYLIILATSILCLITTSCIHRPLTDPAPATEIRVIIRTDSISNITRHIYNPAIARPDLECGMLELLVYDASGKELLFRSFMENRQSAPDGKEFFLQDILLPPGEYRFLAYNFDTENTRVRDHESYGTVCAYTEDMTETAGNLLKSETDTPVFREPDHLFVARKDVEIKLSETKKSIEMQARTIIDTYYLQVRVNGMQWAVSGLATVSGMSRSNLIGPDIRYEEEGSCIMFPLQCSSDRNIKGENKDVMCALFSTFGKIAHLHSDLTIRFDIVTQDGTRYVKTLGLDKAFLSEDGRIRHWLLLDAVLNIPEPHHPGGGFDPAIFDWDEIHQDIII